MNKVPLFHHFTEFLDETHQYLKDFFVSDDIELLDFGADIRVGSAIIEVKACREYIKAKCSNGSRRRGRFKFDHISDSDWTLFILMKENGEYRKRLMRSVDVEYSILKDCSRTSINHSEIFA